MLLACLGLRAVATLSAGTGFVLDFALRILNRSKAFYSARQPHLTADVGRTIDQCGRILRYAARRGYWRGSRLPSAVERVLDVQASAQ